VLVALLLSFSEPITTLTDYAIALESLIFAGLLWQKPDRHPAVQGWVVAFLGVAIAAALGGTWHATSADWPEPIIRLLWQGMVLALGLASFGMLAGSVLSTVPRRWQAAAMLAIFVKSLVYLSGATACESFDCAIADYFSAMLIVLLLHWNPARKKSSSARWIVGGVAVSAIAIAVVASGFSPGFLTHNDLYHLIQMVALYSFYRGVKLFGDRH